MKRIGLTLLCLSLAACAELAGPGATTTQSPAPAVQREMPEPDRRSVDLLAFMERLVVVSDEQWNSLHRELAASGPQAGDAEHDLRMALVLSTPGRNGSDDTRARELLQQLVSQPSTLSKAEVQVARLRLAEIRARADLRERVHSLEDSVAELEQKIRALTQIEETVSPTGVQLGQ